MRNFDSKYMKMAKIWSTNSYAIRHKVGAIIVKDGIIISDGFNGTPAGFENECEYIVPCGNTCTNLFGQDCETCKEHKLKTKPYVLHAEANAIDNFRGYKKEFEDSRIYVDLFPCNECAKKIIQNGFQS